MATSAPAHRGEHTDVTCLACGTLPRIGHLTDCPAADPNATGILTETLAYGTERIWTVVGARYTLTPARRQAITACMPGMRWVRPIDRSSLSFHSGALVNEVVPQLGIANRLAGIGVNELATVAVPLRFPRSPVPPRQTRSVARIRAARAQGPLHQRLGPRVAARHRHRRRRRRHRLHRRPGRRARHQGVLAGLVRPLPRHRPRAHQRWRPHAVPLLMPAPPIGPRRRAGAVVRRGTRDGQHNTGANWIWKADPMTRHAHMSDEAIMATIDAIQGQPGHTYPVELSYTDFSNLMWALQKIWHDGVGPRSEGFTDLGDLAGSWARSIAATLGVQMV